METLVFFLYSALLGYVIYCLDVSQDETLEEVDVEPYDEEVYR